MSTPLDLQCRATIFRRGEPHRCLYCAKADGLCRIHLNERSTLPRQITRLEEKTALLKARLDFLSQPMETPMNTPIRASTLLSLGFVYENLDGQAPYEWWVRDGLHVWKFNGRHWVVNELDQGGIRVEFHMIGHLDELWRACRKPPLIPRVSKAIL